MNTDMHNIPTWKIELQQHFSDNDFNSKEYFEVLKDSIPGNRRDDKKAKYNRVLNNLEVFGTVFNPNSKCKSVQASQTASQNDSSLLPHSFEYNNGTYIYDRIIEVAEGTDITPEVMLKAHNLDPNVWDVVMYKNNFWNTLKKGGVLAEMYQSKLTVKPKAKAEITFDDINNYFENKDWNVKPIVAPFKYDNSKETLDINYCDAHIGLLAWRNEAGKDYDVHIAVDRFKETISDIVKRCEGRKFKLINFATLGDILHIDNTNNETNKGTRQDVDCRLPKLFDLGVDTIIDVIDILLTLNCPIQYTYVCGNHDTFSGYALAKCVEKAFSKNPNVTFDVKPLPQKTHVYGNTLVGYCHGSMNSKNLGEWLQKKFRPQYGASKFAEVHCGHLHSEAVKENCGVLIKHLPAICESSYWEASEGYCADKGIMCFVYNDITGLRETWYTYL